MSDLTIPELNKRLKKLGRISGNKDDEYIAELEAKVDALQAKVEQLETAFKESYIQGRIRELEAALIRLADKDYMHRPNFTRQRGTDPNWLKEVEARVDYARAALKEKES